MNSTAYRSEARSYIEYVLNDKRFSGMLQTNSGTNSDSGHGGNNTGGNTVIIIISNINFELFCSQMTSKMINRMKINQLGINLVSQIAKDNLMNDFQMTS